MNTQAKSEFDCSNVQLVNITQLFPAVIRGRERRQHQV